MTSDRLPFITLGFFERRPIHITRRREQRLVRNLQAKAHGHLEALLKKQADQADTGAGPRRSEPNQDITFEESP